MRGYWSNKIGNPHTVPYKGRGHCGSVLVYLIPVSPKHKVSAPVTRNLLLMAGTVDWYSSARGCTATLDDLTRATFDAISKTYSCLTPDL